MATRQRIGDSSPASRWAVEPSAAVLAGIGEPPTLLEPEQRARQLRLRQERDRDDFVAARVLTQRLVAQASGYPADEVRFSQHCDRCGGPDGRPLIEGSSGLHISWSHARGWVAAVVSDQPCGIDVEPVSDSGPLFHVLTFEEQQEVRSVPAGSGQSRAFLRLWVRKEALVKAAGTGLSEPAALAQLDVRADDVAYADQHWQLTDLTTPSDVVAAIAVRSS